MNSSPMTSAEFTITPDFVFNPTDERLVGLYLPHKICGNDNLVSVIAEIGNICDYEPWDLRWLAAIPSEDTWHFFSRPDRKYKKSGNTNRLTRAGYWKVTGKERGIKNRATNQVIGFKRVLVFYRGRARDPEWTNWTIHEYYLKSSSNGEDYVISRLNQNPLKKTVNSVFDEGEPSHDSVSEMDLDPQFMEELLNDSNGQQPNGVTDDYTLSRSQFGTTPQQDKILEGKSNPAIQDAHSYSDSMQIPPSDSSPSESSGSQPVEDNSDIEAFNTLMDCIDEVGDHSLQDWWFEPAPACFP